MTKDKAVVWMGIALALAILPAHAQGYDPYASGGYNEGYLRGFNDAMNGHPAPADSGPVYAPPAQPVDDGPGYWYSYQGNWYLYYQGRSYYYPPAPQQAPIMQAAPPQQTQQQSSSDILSLLSSVLPYALDFALPTHGHAYQATRMPRSLPIMRGR